MLSPRSKGGKGAEMILTRKVPGAYDPATGKPSVTITQYAGSGFRDTYELKNVDGTLIRRDDVKLLVSPVLLTGEDTPRPMETDTIIFDGTAYTVVGVEPWNYAGITVGFEVQART